MKRIIIWVDLQNMRPKTGQVSARGRLRVLGTCYLIAIRPHEIRNMSPGPEPVRRIRENFFVGGPARR
jgi:hypothetical protein